MRPAIEAQPRTVRRHGRTSMHRALGHTEEDGSASLGHISSNDLLGGAVEERGLVQPGQAAG